jgi:hypothetical protein
MLPIPARRSGFLAAAIATLALAPAGAQERVSLRGTSVTLTAPPGFTVTRDGKGLENAATGSSITVAERPADAYAELAARFASPKSLSEGYAGQGVTIRSVRTIAAPGGSVPFAVGRQASQAALSPELTKYLALLKGDRTVLVTFTIGDRAFTEADAEAVLRSIELTKDPTVDEQLATLPFALRIVAPFRVTNVRARASVTLAVDTPGPGAGEPAIVIARGSASAGPGEEPQVAVDLLKNTSGLRDAQIVRAEAAPFAGGTGFVVDASVGERKVTQYLRILPGGSYVRFLARGPASAMDEQAAPIDEIARSVDAP